MFEMLPQCSVRTSFWSYLQTLLRVMSSVGLSWAQGHRGSRQWPLGTPGPSGGAVCVESLRPECRAPNKVLLGALAVEGTTPPTQEQRQQQSYFSHMPLLLMEHVAALNCPCVLECQSHPVLLSSSFSMSLSLIPASSLSPSLASFSISHVHIPFGRPSTGSLLTLAERPSVTVTVILTHLPTPLP